MTTVRIRANSNPYGYTWAYARDGWWAAGCSKAHAIMRWSCRRLLRVCGTGTVPNEMLAGEDAS